MRLIFAALLCLPAVSSAAPQQPTNPMRTPAEAARSDCPSDPSLRMARRPGKPAKVTRLGDEPSASLALTVYRQVDGCHEPAILREGIGYTPGRPPSALNP
jgi:hypothetical protein